MGQAQINVRIRACSRTSIARTKQAALTHNVRGKELSQFENKASKGQIRSAYVVVYPATPTATPKLPQLAEAYIANINAEGYICSITQRNQVH